jgi:hypothetical protein
MDIDTSQALVGFESRTFPDRPLPRLPPLHLPEISCTCWGETTGRTLLCDRRLTIRALIDPCFGTTPKPTDGTGPAVICPVSLPHRSPRGAEVGRSSAARSFPAFGATECGCFARQASLCAVEKLFDHPFGVFDLV